MPFRNPSFATVSFRDCVTRSISDCGRADGKMVETSANERLVQGAVLFGSVGFVIWSAEDEKSSLTSLQISSPSSKIKFTSTSDPEIYGYICITTPGNLSSIRCTAEMTLGTQRGTYFCQFSIIVVSISRPPCLALFTKSGPKTPAVRHPPWIPADKLRS